VAENGETSSVDETGIVPFGDSEVSRHRAVLTELESDTLYRIIVDHDTREWVLFLRSDTEEGPRKIGEPVLLPTGFGGRGRV
jgi:hypothetical protein